MMKSILYLLLLLSNSVLWGQKMKEPIVWDFSVKQCGENSYQVKSVATISDPWAIYSHYLPKDADPIPSNIAFTTVGVLKKKPLKEKGHKITFDKLYGEGITKYKKKLTFLQEITIDKPISKIEGYIVYMVCNESQCMPPKQVAFILDLDKK